MNIQDAIGEELFGVKSMGVKVHTAVFNGCNAILFIEFLVSDVEYDGIDCKINAVEEVFK